MRRDSSWSLLCFFALLRDFLGLKLIRSFSLSSRVFVFTRVRKAIQKVIAWKGKSAENRRWNRILDKLLLSISSVQLALQRPSKVNEQQLFSRTRKSDRRRVNLILISPPSISPPSAHTAKNISANSNLSCSRRAEEIILFWLRKLSIIWASGMELDVKQQKTEPRRDRKTT